MGDLQESRENKRAEKIGGILKGLKIWKIFFEVVDKTGRKIRFTKRQWSHIIKGHKYMVEYL